MMWNLFVVSILKIDVSIFKIDLNPMASYDLELNIVLSP